MCCFLTVTNNTDKLSRDSKTSMQSLHKRALVSVLPLVACRALQATATYLAIGSQRTSSRDVNIYACGRLYPSVIAVAHILKHG